ncbi:MAG: hypothetical protein GF313_13110 [Caldithrix sp.]|nr:hypothetical protein [Caldithrix sp.]
MIYTKVISIGLLSALLLNGCTKTDRTMPEESNQQLHNKSATAETQDTTMEGLDLPVEFQTLLRQEMRQIEKGMKHLLTDLVRGRPNQAERMAQRIHNSFILKQQLSKQELKQLIKLLPDEFVRRDRIFHKQAKQLAEASKENNFQKSAKIYGQMVNGCVGCHSRFAAERFPKMNRPSN